MTQKQKHSIREFFGLWKNDKEIEKIYSKIIKERHNYYGLHVMGW